MKIVSVVGARPNFMKAAPIVAAIHRHNQLAAESGHPESVIEHRLVHTGQHYDARMSDSFFADLNMPAPDIQLGVGAGSQLVQTSEILRKFETVLLEERPDVVIVVGDVNSTLACAIATSKIVFDATGKRPLLAHVESGLRSFDRLMPEEINRVLTDHVADLLFVTEPSGLDNLRNEGIATSSVHFVGNTMIDSLLAYKDKADQSKILEQLGLRNEEQLVDRYALLTLHRPSNVDHRETFLNILGGLEELGGKCPIVFPVHPRTRQRIAEMGLQPHVQANGLVLTDPLGYLDFVCLMKNAAVVVTDSGGIQEETTCLGVPCVTVRENTERPVTVDSGTNIIAGTSQRNVAEAIRRQMGRQGVKAMPKKWDGQSAGRIVEILIQAHRDRSAPQTHAGSPFAAVGSPADAPAVQSI